MRQIAITGGKGGTGKSTFSIMLANKLVREGKKVVLCDADVECPNNYLILDRRLENPRPIYAQYPKIEASKCTRCRVCVENCRFNALFQIGDDAPKLVQNLCSSCGLCWGLCPEGAIGIRKEQCGSSYTTKVKENLWLVTGESLPGIEETGPIVREARERSLRLAEEVEADFLLVDTAAGTHCSVINALLDSEQAYVVTEPTPLGVHDSRLMIKLLNILNIPLELVLNKAGVGKDSVIEELSEELGVKIGFRIPYSEEIVSAYSRGKIDEIKLI